MAITLARRHGNSWRRKRRKRTHRRLPLSTCHISYPCVWGLNGRSEVKVVWGFPSGKRKENKGEERVKAWFMLPRTAQPHLALFSLFFNCFSKFLQVSSSLGGKPTSGKTSQLRFADNAESEIQRGDGRITRRTRSSMIL